MRFCRNNNYKMIASIRYWMSIIRFAISFFHSVKKILTRYGDLRSAVLLLSVTWRDVSTLRTYISTGKEWKFKDKDSAVGNKVSNSGGVRGRFSSAQRFDCRAAGSWIESLQAQAARWSRCSRRCTEIEFRNRPNIFVGGHSRLQCTASSRRPGKLPDATRRSTYTYICITQEKSLSTEENLHPKISG